MKHKIFILVIIMATSIFLLNIISNHNKMDNNSEKITVRLKWLHQSQFAGFYYADKAGYYIDAGLDVSLNPGGVDFPAIQMVASGSDQFGIASFEQILIARSKGIPVVAVANIYRQTPLIIFSFKDKNITRPKDLIGKKIAITLDPDEQLVYQSILRKVGIDRSKIKEKIFKYDPSLLVTGKVDAMIDYSISKPLSIEKETGKKLNRIYPAAYGVNFYADTLFTTEKMIKQKPKIVDKFVQATIKGWKKAFDDQKQAITYTLEYNNQLDKTHQANMLRESNKFISLDKKSSFSYIDQKTVEKTYKFLLDNKYINNEINPRQAYTNEFN